MVSLRSKLYPVRQGRKAPPRLLLESRPEAPCLADCKYKATATPAAACPPQAGALHLPTRSTPRRPTLDTLPDELVQKVAFSCGPDAVLCLRETCRTLHRALDSAYSLSEFARQRMDPTTPGAPDRKVIIEMIRAQSNDDHPSRDRDEKREAFLCLAVTIPARERARIKAAMGPLLARARSNASTLDMDCPVDQHLLHHARGRDGQADGSADHADHADLAGELEEKLEVISTLCVLGYSDICDVELGMALMAINPWAIKANIWSEKRLLAQKQLSMQLALTMTLGLLRPWDWSKNSSESPEYHSLAHRVIADYHGEDFTSSNQSFWLSWEGLHTRSLQLAGLIAYILNVGGAEDVPRSELIPFLRDNTAESDAAKTTPSLRPPRLKVPLLEKTSRGGIRGRPNSWREWYTTRVRDLVSSMDDEKDEWYGYYVYTLTNTDNLSPLGSRDPAMEKIRFKLGRTTPPSPTVGGGLATATRPSPTSNPAPQKLPLEARACQDGVTCSFDFAGTVAPATGIVSLRKDYVGAHYWDYEGVMTPLGIVGEWGKEGTGFNGYFWLWKRSWMGVDGDGQRAYAYS